MESSFSRDFFVREYTTEKTVFDKSLSICWGVAKLVRQRVLVPSFMGSSPITPALIFLRESRGKRRKVGESGKKTFKKNTPFKPQRCNCYPVEYQF